jgi:outer membrane protein
MKSAGLTLLRILGIPASANIEVAMPHHPLLLTEPDTNRAAMLVAALGNRPDLLAQQRDLAAAGAQIRVARSTAYPTLDLVAGVGSGYNSRSQTGFGGQYDHDNLYGSAGLSLSVPIFDRNLARHQVSQARLSEQASRLILERLQRQVEVEIGQALADYQNARDQIAVAAAQAAYGREALHSTEQRYRVGAATLTDLTDARRTLVSARYAETAAHIEQMRQTVAITYHRGELDAAPFLKERSE